MRLLSIDPGTTESGWCVIDEHYRPLEFGKTENEQLLDQVLTSEYDEAVIEMFASYGMPVGAEVFATCVMIGRYLQAIKTIGIPVELRFRLSVKQNLCHRANAKDANISQALVDRFAYGQGNHGKGTKAAPGWFHGFAKDVWAAYALAVTHLDHKPSLARL